jgi:hypothetical protein
VTVGGQSAGAGDMHFLALSPTAKGLFRGLIAQSGSKAWNDQSLPNPMMWLNLADAEKEGVKYVEPLGAKSIKELRALPWQQLLALKGPVPNRAVIGGTIFPEGFAATYAKGKQNDVAFMTGANLDEHGPEPHPRVDAGGPRPLRRQRGCRPEAVSGGDRCRCPGGVQRGHARLRARQHVPVGVRSPEDLEDQGLYLLLDAFHAGPE